VVERVLCRLCCINAQVVNYLSNLPAYRTGVSPLLRGVEIGLAHGFLLPGPFIKVGCSPSSSSKSRQQNQQVICSSYSVAAAGQLGLGMTAAHRTHRVQLLTVEWACQHRQVVANSVAADLCSG
jgi:hypothetical protein